MDLDSRLDERPGKRALEYLDGVPFPKSSLRMQYEAETKVFRDQHGGLENIREKLGFSRRKMCQLLLVDPSAWTRWMKDESKVPPHIYRSLEWFLALNQKALTQPDLAAIFSARFKVSSPDAGVSASFQREISSLKAELHRQRRVSSFLMAGMLMFGLVLVFVLFR